jgi:hypothetical protein
LSQISYVFFFFFFFFFSSFPPFSHQKSNLLLALHTFDMLQQGNHRRHGRHRQFAYTPWGHWLLQRKSRPVTDGAVLLQLDKLAQVGQSRLHLGIHSRQGRFLDGTLEEFAGKGCVDGQARVAAEDGFLVGAVIVSGRRGGWHGGVCLWRMDEF